MVDWKPSAPLQNLQQRAQTIAKIRDFFAERDVLEVETPSLAGTTVSDVYIESIVADVIDGGERKKRFLQTSPEFFMKRLLASGSGSIYQIAKAFRQEEKGSRHNSEFTLLEWYRLDYSLEDLMTEVEELMKGLVANGAIPRYTYRELFQEYMQIDPFEISLSDLKKLADSTIELEGSALSKTDYLQLLLATVIEPKLPEYCFIYDYPAEQAALATLAQDQSDCTVARRFELFGRGMELANGYLELRDGTEQRARFESDNVLRKEKGLEIREVDEKLIAALDEGLPSCSGVALGVDRVMMLLTDAVNISEVISFDSERI